MMFAVYIFVCAILASCIPFGYALVCFQCSNITGRSMMDCNNPANQTCDANYNSCMIASMKLDTPFPDSAFQMARNCSVNCNADSEYCEGMNKTASGKLLECKTHCCTGDLCNLNMPVSPTSGPTAGPHSNTTTTATPTDKTTEPSSAAQMYSGIALLAVVLGKLMDDVLI